MKKLFFVVLAFFFSVFTFANNEAPFRTQTQGGWGQNPSGENTGFYLHQNFEEAFPRGVVIGSGLTLTFTSASAITKYLPGGGRPKALTASATDPMKAHSVLASQLLAATLSVEFDKYDSDFSSSSALLENQFIAKGIFKGMTVKEFLSIANLALGSEKYEAKYKLSEIADALAKLNQSFVDGKRNTGFISVKHKENPSDDETEDDGEYEEQQDKNKGMKKSQNNKKKRGNNQKAKTRTSIVTPKELKSRAKKNKKTLETNRVDLPSLR